MKKSGFGGGLTGLSLKSHSTVSSKFGDEEEAENSISSKFGDEEEEETPIIGRREEANDEEDVRCCRSLDGPHPSSSRPHSMPSRPLPGASHEIPPSFSLANTHRFVAFAFRRRKSTRLLPWRRPAWHRRAGAAAA